MKTETTELPAIIDEARAAGCENADQIHGYLAAEVSRLRAMGDLRTRLNRGRDYLMQIPADEITVEGALVAFGWTSDGLREENNQVSNSGPETTK